MRDKLGPGTTLSYCTNVHAGFKLKHIERELLLHATEVQRLVCPDEKLGIGLWTPYWPTKLPLAIASLLAVVQVMLCQIFLGRYPRDREVERFSRFLSNHGLETTTANAFPFGNFHQPIVKHRVYEPDLADRLRLLQLIGARGILNATKATDSEPIQPSISTVPIGWSTISEHPERIELAGAHLRRLALAFAKIHDDQSSTIDLEPEPGCYLDTCDDVIAFFDEHLPDPMHRAHIGVCHDVCHAAVMFEDQREVLRRYAEAGIRVNKVQISSALDVDVGTLGVKNTIDRLRAFAEPRYLHQTGFMLGGRFELIEDLPFAIQRLESGTHPGDHPDRLRVHFHVPIYLDRIGDLGTTNDQIMDAVLAAREYHDTKHFEVETYAWGVLPKEHQRDTLAAGIADELQWVLDNIAPAARTVEPTTASRE